MKKKILIIEDSAEVRENMEEILLLSNYEVSTAANGKEGVEAALARVPDLVICDIMMPLLDGYGVLHLLQKHTSTATVPFIFLTAKAEKADLRKGMDMGADDYLTKPFDGIELLHAVETRLKKHALLQQRHHHSVPAALPALTGDEREVYTYKKKETLYHEGQRPKAIFYIVQGKVKVHKTHEDGKELISGIYTAGDFLGYLPVLEETNYQDTATVLEEAEIMHIPRQDFLQLLQLDSEVAGKFIRLMASAVSVKEEALLNLAYNSLRKKVAYGLVSIGAKYRQQAGENCIITMPRETMAQAIGVATESLIRTLAEFKEEGLVTLQPGKVEVLQYEQLRHLRY
jgi:CRP/FNR family transcriptional regulator, cyclic AMP receptor protein